MSRPPISDLASTAGARGGEQAVSTAAASDPTIAAAARIASGQRHVPGALLPILHAIQAELGCIPPAAVQTVAETLNLSRAEVHGVITFYPHFRSAPAGRHVIEICRAESCQAMGGDRLAEHARGRLGCDFHGTTADGGVTLEPVYCLGLCAQSPNVAMDGRAHARMTPEKLDRLLAQARAA